MNALRALVASLASAPSAVQAQARLGRVALLARALGTTEALGELARAEAGYAVRWMANAGPEKRSGRVF